MDDQETLVTNSIIRHLLCYELLNTNDPFSHPRFANLLRRMKTGTELSEEQLMSRLKKAFSLT